MPRALWTLPAAVFAWLAYAVTRGETAGFDLAGRDAVHAWASPSLTWAMYATTQLGSAIPLIVLGTLVAWRLGPWKRVAVLLLVAAAGAEAIDQVLKLIFHRPRPEMFFGLAQPQTYSFPSGHAMSACCFYGMAAVLVTARVRSRGRRAAIWIVAALIAGAVGLSRVYLGAHYPTDVMGGYLAGAAWVLLAQMIQVD